VFQCNRLCGEGVQKRQVRCFRRVEGKIEVLGDSACHEEKPEEEKPCELRPCEGVDWVVSDWSGVSENPLPYSNICFTESKIKMSVCTP
jgi:hypothetical protein